MIADADADGGLPCIFAMISTAASLFYTQHAIDSFFACTRLRAADRFLLIVNDHDSGEFRDRPRVELVENETPKGFAANVNLVLRSARASGADVVLLNNDMIFTEGWLEPLRSLSNCIALPMCNQVEVYRRDGLDLSFAMDWEQFGGRFDLLQEIARSHRERYAEGETAARLLMPFYCFRLPNPVLAALGDFDESFGVGGGEDVDYRLRALLAGFDVVYAARSYVLHFMGKSTWRSGEARAATVVRDEVYRRRFRQKWGADAAELFLANARSGEFLAALNLGDLAARGDYRTILEHCMSNTSSGFIDPIETVGFGATDASREVIASYLDLMERCLLNTIYEDRPFDSWSGGEFRAETRRLGRDWPSVAHTMIGHERLRNFRALIETVILENIPGDIIETGVWRGGACIMARAVLKAYGIVDRLVWVADSFEGLPPPDPVAFPADANDRHFEIEELAVSLEEVQRNFDKYGLRDGQVTFLKGWFKDTLPTAPIERLAVIRLDGDMYQSTMDAIGALYDKLQPGGFVIVDDYGAVEGCRRAITDYRMARGIVAPLIDIDGMGVYWRKP